MAAPSRNTQPQSPVSPVLVVFVGVLASLVATWFRYPGFVVLAVSFLVAGVMASPPVLTGPKDSAGYPTEGNDAESKKMASYRFWKYTGWRTLVPNRHWVPTSVVHVAAVGVAVAAATLPVDSLNQWWFVGNMVAGYAVVAQTFESKRVNADLFDEQPAVSFAQVVGWVKRWRETFAQLVGVGVTVVVAGFAAAIVLRVFRVDWLVWPPALFGAGVGLASGAFLVWVLLRPGVVEKWEWTRQSRATWNFRWDTVTKLKTKPALISHDRFLDGAVTVDVFEAPADIGGAKAVIEMRTMLLPAMPNDSMTGLVSVDDVNLEGEPVPGSRHMLRFKVINWLNSATPDVADPASDPEVVGLWLQMLAGVYATEQAQYQPILVGGPTPLHEEPQDGSRFTAAWETVWTVPEYPVDEYMPLHADNFSEKTGHHCTGSQDRIYVGPVRELSTPLKDPSLREQLEVWDMEAQWGYRWEMALPLGYQKPFIQSGEYVAEKLASGQTIHSMPFVVGVGLSPQQYFEKTSAAKLATAIGSAPFVTLTGAPASGFGVRPGERHPSKFTVVWSMDQVPSTPDKLRPSPQGEGGVDVVGRGGRGVARRPGGRSQSGAKLVLTGMLNEAFIGARLARPEIISVKCLTDPKESMSHIWDVNIRLYDGVTFAAVKNAAEKIRETTGAAWLRVTTAKEGCRVVMGASPVSEGVVFVPGEELVCASLDWEQAFTDAKLVNMRGETPQLVDAGVMPKNPKVQRLIFRLPGGVDVSQVRAGASKLSGATGNMFIEVRASDTGADQVVVLASPDSPMPFPAPIDWDEVAANSGVAFGVGVDGEPVAFNTDDDPHLLILGLSGGGKSFLAMDLLTPFAMKGCDIYLADPMKMGADFKYLEPWLKALAVDAFTASEMMNAVVAEVERRRELNSEYGVATYKDLPESVRPNQIVVFIDEVTSLLTIDKPVKPTGKETETQLRELVLAEQEHDARRNIGMAAGRIVREARSAGVVLILAGQSLKASTLDAIPGGNTIKGNMARIVLGKASYGDLASALKSPDEAPKHLGDSVPRGRGIFESSTTKPIVFQAYADPDQAESMVRHIREVREPLPTSMKLDLTGMVEQGRADVAVFGQIVGDAVWGIAEVQGGLDFGDVENEIIEVGELIMDDIVLDQGPDLGGVGVEPGPSGDVSVVPLSFLGGPDGVAPQSTEAAMRLFDSL